MPSPIIKELIEGIKTLPPSLVPSTFKKSPASTSAVTIYETIRNFIDYKDEHLLRRNAIERILRRKLLIIPETNIAPGLIRELSWAGYIDFEPVNLNQIEKSIDKYLHLLKMSIDKLPPAKYQDWILELASAEIEEHLVPRVKEEAINRAMFRVLSNKDNFLSTIKPADRDLQIFLAVRRSLFKEDIATIRYHLLLTYIPAWPNANQQLIDNFTQNIHKFYHHLEAKINDSSAIRLSKSVRPITPPFLILKDIIDQNPDLDSLFENTEHLLDAVEFACDKRYRSIKSKVSRSIFRSTVYIFLTKMVLAYIFEMPADLYLYGKVKLIPLSINTIFPPSLMYLIGTSIKLPGNSNSEKIKTMILELVTTSGPYLSFNIKSGSRPSSLKGLFAIFYSVGFALSFGIIILLLSLLNFGIISGILFILFLCIVSFFAFRIRQTAKEYMVEEKKTGFAAGLVDLFALPFLQMGQWLSNKFSRLNILMFIFDFVIEAPFKAFIQIAEDWIQFLKQKKEEIA